METSQSSGEPAWRLFIKSGVFAGNFGRSEQSKACDADRGPHGVPRASGRADRSGARGRVLEGRGTLDLGFGASSRAATAAADSSSASRVAAAASGSGSGCSPLRFGFAAAASSSSLRAMPPLPRLRKGAEEAAGRRLLFGGALRFFPAAGHGREENQKCCTACTVCSERYSVGLGRFHIKSTY